jgi:hypothetical protein
LICLDAGFGKLSHLVTKFVAQPSETVLVHFIDRPHQLRFERVLCNSGQVPAIGQLVFERQCSSHFEIGSQPPEQGCDDDDRQPDAADGFQVERSFHRDGSLGGCSFRIPVRDRKCGGMSIRLPLGGHPFNSPH